MLNVFKGSNDYMMIYQLNSYCRVYNLGDLIAMLGSVDFVLGSVDLWFDYYISLFYSLSLTLFRSALLILIIC